MKPTSNDAREPGAVQRMVRLPVELAERALEHLYDLRGERAWWKDEPRCNYQRDYLLLGAAIAEMEAALGRQPNE